MPKFERLTKYIPLIDQPEIGQWVVDKEKDGTMENPIRFPFVAYSELVSKFIEDVGTFVDANPDLQLTQYSEILEQAGLEWSSRSMSGAIVEDLDGKVVCALIVGAVRAERFCDGALLNFFQNGCVVRWLHRLQEIDKFDNASNIRKENF